MKVALVNYLNTYPLLHGLQTYEWLEKPEFICVNPAECARKIINGEVEIALVPSVILAEYPELKMQFNYGIGATDKVNTVCVVGHSKIQDWKKVYLDSHSNTSVQLLKQLLKEYWHLDLELEYWEKDIPEINNDEGILFIGDKAFYEKPKYSQAYDLGEYWWKMTNLPFVFAVWVSRIPINPQLEFEFNQAMQQGIENIPSIIYELSPKYPDLNLQHYFMQNIEYKLSLNKRKALKLFLDNVNETAPLIAL